MKRTRSLGAAAGLAVLGAAVIRVIRTVPLVQEEPLEEGPGTKKGEKKDFKKKGNGPRTRRKKAKKGK